VIPEEPYEQALHRTLSQINERFGADHPVTGEPRLDIQERV